MLALQPRKRFARVRAYESAQDARVEATGEARSHPGRTSRIVVRDGRIPLLEQLSEDGRTWAASITWRLRDLPPTDREEILIVAQQALWYGERGAARLLGLDRTEVTSRMATLTHLTGLDLTDRWQHAALYAAVRVAGCRLRSQWIRPSPWSRCSTTRTRGRGRGRSRISLSGCGRTSAGSWLCGRCTGVPSRSWPSSASAAPPSTGACAGPPTPCPPPQQPVRRFHPATVRTGLLRLADRPDRGEAWSAQSGSAANTGPVSHFFISRCGRR
jgi:hypothetical protein